MLKWWNSQAQANKMMLIAAVVGAILTAILSGLFSTPARNRAFEGGIIQSSQSGTNIVNTGSGLVNAGDTYHIGITLEQYEQGLKRREVEVRAELKLAHAKNRKVLESEDQVVQKKLQSSTASYETYMASLKERIAQLENLRGQLPDEILEKAKKALAQGSSQQADELFKQIEEQADSVIKVAAEAAYQRCLLAEDDIRYVAALEHCEKAARLAPDHSLYLNQAGTINHILANHKKAIGYYEQALASDFKTFEEGHPKVAIRRNNLGNAWNSLGNYQKAIGYYEQALVSDLKTYGEAHPKVAIRRNNLGEAWRALGEYQKAIKYYEQTLASDLKIYGEAHPDVAIDRNNLGAAWYSLGEYEKAIGYYDQALTSDLKTYGEDHPDVAIRRNNLGETWRALGEYQKAIEYYELALATFEQKLGHDHPSTQMVKANLAQVREKLAESATE